MTDDPMIQGLTLIALVLGVILPLQFHQHLKKLILLAIALLIVGFISFTFLVIVQSSSPHAIVIFYFSMFTWMFGFILVIHTLIQKIRRSN